MDNVKGHDASRAYASRLHRELADLHRGTVGREEPASVTSWNDALDADAEILRALPEEQLRRRAWAVREAFRRCSTAATWAAYEASLPPDAAQAPVEALRADLVELQREMNRTRLLTSEFERTRSELSAWLAWVGLAALAALIVMLTLDVIVRVVERQPREALMVGLIVLLLLGAWLIRRYRTKKGGVAGALLLCLLASFSDAQQPPAPTPSSPTTQEVKTEEAGPTGRDRARFGATTLTMVMLAGLLGALFSTLRRVQTAAIKIDPVTELMLFDSARTGALLSAIAGVVAALFLYTIFVGGLLQGALFPNFGPAWDKETPMTFLEFIKAVGPKGPIDHGKLLVWSFIAGFAERFVPDLIQRLTNRADEAKH